MMSWKLWYALTHPPTIQPLYRRITMLDQHHWLWGMGWRLSLIGLLLGGIAYYPTLFVPFLLLAPVLFLALGGTIFGLVWTSSIATTIARLRRSGLYDLLSITPPGGLGVSWSISVACLHRDRAFRRTSAEIRGVTVLLIGFVLISGVGLMLSPADYPLERSLAQLSAIIGLLVAAYLDFQQSIILALEAGIAGANLAEQQADVRIKSFGLFIGLQLLTYLAAFSVGFLVLPVIYAALGLTSVLAGLSLSLLRILLLYTIRNLIIALLWRQLALRLNTDANDLALS